MNWSTEVALEVPPEVVTVTSTVAPRVPAGETAMQLVAEQVALAAAVVPKSIAISPERFVPLTVTVVPPAAGPLEGEIPVTVGATDATVTLPEVLDATASPGA